jgi:hypothetical protein
VIRRGTICLQIVALLRSATPLAPNSTKAVQDAIHRHQRRLVPGVRHHQTRVDARSERMIPPPSTTALASSKP